MNRYLVSVKINSQIVRTVVDADSAVHARLLVDYRFGMGSLVGQPVRVAEGAGDQYPLLDDVVAAVENIQPIKTVMPVKPAASPEQARINSLKQTKAHADTALKAERNRQKIVRAQQALYKSVR